MASITMTYPADGGVLPKDAAGIVAAFTATGYTDQPGAAVTLTDTTIGRLLGTTSSATVPIASGPGAGQYAWSVAVAAYDSTVAATSAPAASATTSGAAAGAKAGAVAAVASVDLGSAAAPVAAGARASSATATSSIASASPTTVGPTTVSVNSVTASVAAVAPAAGTSASASTAALSVSRATAMPGVQPSGASADASTTSAGAQTAGPAGAAVTDDFNRANASTLGANWTTAPGSSGALRILSNQAAGSTLNDAAFYSGAVFAANQYAQATGNYGAGGAGRTGVRVRNASGADTYYALSRDDYDDGMGTVFGRLGIFKCVAGTRTMLGAYVVASGAEAFDGLRLEVVGTTLTAKWRTGAGAWSSDTRTDSSIASGSPGIEVVNGLSIDNFAAGDL